MIIFIKSTNDVNGNPRRAWIELDENGIKKNVFNEGYMGYNAVPKRIREQAKSCIQIRVSIKEYKELIK
tara:strand:+ start:872 stop:1078 length:207 start_codon:yes stop_codon:yes gene_type:complete